MTSIAFPIRAELLGLGDDTYRLLLVPARATLQQLHLMLQAAFDWESEHLYGYRASRGKSRDVGGIDWDLVEVDSPEVTLEWVFGRVARFTYEYDYGASWKVEISRAPAKVVPARAAVPSCIGGAGADPGERGFASRHHFASKRKAFTVAKVNRRLADVAKPWSRETDWKIVSARRKVDGTARPAASRARDSADDLEARVKRLLELARGSGERGNSR